VKKLKNLFSMCVAFGIVGSVHAGERLHCTTFLSSGHDVKLATLEQGGRVIALNGQARARAAKNGWIDGREVFDPASLRQRSEEALAICDGKVQTKAATPAERKEVASTPVSANTKSLTAQALVDAANNDNIGFIKAYVASGNSVNVSVTTVVGTETAVAAAAASGHCEALDLLLNAGGTADPKGVRVGFTPLSLAATAGAASCVRLLLKRHVRLDVRTTSGGDTALIIASYHGYAEVVKDLVEAGASLKLSNNDGDSPYRAALVFGNKDVAKYLKSRGAS
jgi:ankyrin repeat protein